MPLMLSEPRLSCRDEAAVGDLALLLPFVGAAPEEEAEPPMLGKLQVELDMIEMAVMVRVGRRLTRLSCARPYRWSVSCLRVAVRGGRSAGREKGGYLLWELGSWLLAIQRRGL